MLNDKQKEKLKSSWGDKAEALDCLAEVRVYDPLSDWQCYIYAMNPDNENEILCLISLGKNLFPVFSEWTMHEISLLYNSHGENAEIDLEYRPRNINEIYKKLRESHTYERERH
jgi:hypothetical protein